MGTSSSISLNSTIGSGGAARNTKTPPEFSGLRKENMKINSWTIQGNYTLSWKTTNNISNI